MQKDFTLWTSDDPFCQAQIRADGSMQFFGVCSLGEIEFNVCEHHLQDLVRVAKKALKAYRKLERQDAFLDPYPGKNVDPSGLPSWLTGQRNLTAQEIAEAALAEPDTRFSA